MFFANQQSGPGDITEVVSNAVGGVPDFVILILGAMIASGVVMLVLRIRANRESQD